MTIIQKTVISDFQKESNIIVKTKVIKFQELWGNYPKEVIKHIDTKTGIDIFDNHCAINVSESLCKSGVTFNSFKGMKCWSCPNGNSIHAIRAQELADWLKNRPFPGCPISISLIGNDFETSIKGKCGIIFFKDYWQRNGEGRGIRTGDHIDLWEKNELASLGVFFTQIRLIFPQFSEALLSMSDLKMSKSILFWEMK